MKKKCSIKKNVIICILIFVIVLLFDAIAELSPSQKNHFETLSNGAILINTVVSFFWVGLPLKENNSNVIRNVFGNIVNPVIAFLINISIFDHIIRRGHLLEDLLWGWHICWIACTVVLILFLTESWSKLQSEWKNLWEWGKKIIQLVGAFFQESVELIKETDKVKLLIIAGGMILWGLYFKSKASYERVDVILSDTDFLWRSLLLWAIYIVICRFVRYALHLGKSSGVTNVRIARVNWKKILISLGGIIALLVLSLIYPLLQSALGVIALLEAIPIGIVTGAWRKKKRKKKFNNTYIYDGKPREEDVIVLVISYLVIPLFIITLLAFFIFDGDGILVKDEYTLLDFIGVFMETVNNLLKLFG